MFSLVNTTNAQLGTNGNTYTIISDTPPELQFGIGAGVLIYDEVPTVGSIMNYGLNLGVDYNNHETFGISFRADVGPFQEVSEEVNSPDYYFSLQAIGQYHIVRKVNRRQMKVNLKSQNNRVGFQQVETTYYTNVETNEIGLISARAGIIHDNLNTGGFIGGQYTFTRYAKADFGLLYGTKSGWEEFSFFVDLLLLAGENELRDEINDLAEQTESSKIGFRLGAQLRIAKNLHLQAALGKRTYRFLEAGARISFG